MVVHAKATTPFFLKTKTINEVHSVGKIFHLQRAFEIPPAFRVLSPQTQPDIGCAYLSGILFLEFDLILGRLSQTLMLGPKSFQIYTAIIINLRGTGCIRLVPLTILTSRTLKFGLIVPLHCGDPVDRSSSQTAFSMQH